MSDADKIQRLLFDDVDVRGVISGLHVSFKEAVAQHQYPSVVKSVLGQMLAAVTILSSNLKFAAKLSLQAKGDGDISLLMAECDHLNQCRAVAQHADIVADDKTFLELLGKGYLVITIDPEQGQRYQGYVPLEKASLAQCLEDYFERSEQLQSKFILAANEEFAAGFMLQALPAASSEGKDWEHLALLTDTMSEGELLSLDNETVLFRLFHDDKCRLFPAEEIRFHCECSKERSARALKLMGKDELLEIIEERGAVDMGCQFCNANYAFSAADIEQLFLDDSSEHHSEQIH